MIRKMRQVQNVEETHADGQRQSCGSYAAECSSVTLIPLSLAADEDDPQGSVALHETARPAEDINTIN